MQPHPRLRGMARALLGTAVLVCALTNFPATIPEALAGPAARVTREFTQPDGQLLELQLWGDEYAHGWQTLDGYTVRRDKASGWWTYARRDADGQLVASGARVGLDAPVAAPYLRPGTEVLRNRYEEFGAGLAPGEPRLYAPPAWVGGTTRILVIFVEFPADGGEPAVGNTFTRAQAEANLFGGTASGPGNMTDYFDEISFGALDLVGDVVGPFTVSDDKDEYDEGSKDAKDLVAEAIALADPSVDFSQYDNDGDGEVDMVAVMYAGQGPDNGGYEGNDEDVNRLWPHASSISAVNVDGGARTARRYFISPELLGSTTIRTIGVYAHEFGHMIGLPDLYDTDNSSEGIGHWCLMSTGSWTSDTPGQENGESPAHMSAWCKWFQGWITPVDHTGAHVAEDIPQAETNPFAVRLLANPGGPGDWDGDGNGDGEYFLVENRQQTGFDVGLDGCGLLVWHIDESKGSNADEGHSAGTHRIVDLEEADGLGHLDGTGNRGDAGDPFPGSSGNFVFDGSGTPHSDLYDGSDTGIRMSVLSDGCEATMTVTFGNLPPDAVCTDVEVDADEDCLVEVAQAQVDDGSSDPDGDDITLALDPPGPYGLGVNNVELVVTDELGEESRCSATITVVDVTPPDLTCPGDIVVECSVEGGVPMDDPQLDAFYAQLMVEDNCDANPTLDSDLPALFPAKTTTTVTWTATDDSGNVAQCSADVTVVDTTPPIFTTFEISRDVLWPPNHKMVEVEATIEVDDICDPAPVVTLVDARSNEPDNGHGDGDTADDIQGADVGSDDRVVSLRSERSGKGDGRKYTLVYEGSDCSGNSTQDSFCIRVPHDQSGSALAMSGFNADGTGLAPAFQHIRLVLRSQPVSEAPGRAKPTLPDGALWVDARKLEAGGIYLGNTSLVELAQVERERDVDQDGLPDLVVSFPRLAVEQARAAIGDGPVGVHYRSGEVDFLVPDIFALGPPVELPPDIGVDRPGGVKVYPNPFNPQAAVSFVLDGPQLVELVVYNLRGERVRTLASGLLAGGPHDFQWDGRDAAGAPVASGSYVLQALVNGERSVHRLVMLK